MRKFFSIILTVCLLLAATGCNRQPSTPDVETTQPTSEPTQTTQPHSTEATVETQSPALVDLPLLTFSAPVREYAHYAADGTLLLTYSCQDFSLILEDPQVADAIVLDLMNLVDHENSAVQSVQADAQAAYDVQDDWTPFVYSNYFTPERFDQSVLSLYGVHALQSGSPRSATSCNSVTYDLLSGRPLTLKDILKEDYSADALSQLIAEALSPIAAQGLLFSDYAYVASELFTTNRPVDSWYLSNEGLCFYFAPYEIAPYSSGTIIAQIPYASLVDLLRDEFFPSEIADNDGLACVQPFQAVDLAQFDSFAEVVIEESDTQFLLYTSSCIRNLRIELGAYTEDGAFLPEATIFAAPTLCAGDGVVLDATLETTQDLRFTYESNGETISGPTPFVYG